MTTMMNSELASPIGCASRITKLDFVRDHRRSSIFKGHQILDRGFVISREFSVVIERDEEGNYVGSVPALAGCHSQARSLDELVERIREAITLWLEVEGSPTSPEPVLEFVGVQRVSVPT